MKVKFQDIIEDVEARRDPFEAAMFSKQDEIEQKALDLHKKNPTRAREFLTVYSNGLMQEVAAMFLELRDEIITDYTNNLE